MPSGRVVDRRVARTQDLVPAIRGGMLEQTCISGVSGGPDSASAFAFVEPFVTPIRVVAD